MDAQKRNDINFSAVLRSYQHFSKQSIAELLRTILMSWDDQKYNKTSKAALGALMEIMKASWEWKRVE